MRYKCPDCKECLDYIMKDNKYYLFCVLCNKVYILLPGRRLEYYGELNGIK